MKSPTKWLKILIFNYPSVKQSVKCTNKKSRIFYFTTNGAHLFFFFPICKKHKYPFLSLLFSSQLLHFSFMLRYVFFSFLLSFFLINILYKFVFFLFLAHYKISQFYRRTNFIGVWLEVRQWFFYRHHHRRNTSVGFPSVGDSPFRRYIGRKNKKTICRWFYRRNLDAKKKRFPLEIYRRIFIPSVILWLTEEN